MYSGIVFSSIIFILSEKRYSSGLWNLILKKHKEIKASSSHFTLKWSESCSVMFDSLQPHGLYNPWNSPGQNTGVGSFLQGIFPTHGLNPGLQHCRQILYQLSHKGSPRILEWVVYPFSSGSFQPRNQTRVSCIAGGFFTNWAIREAVEFMWKRAIRIILQVRKLMY